MFDIGFWELVLIAVVALVVVGPERLPGMARTAGLWVGRIRRYVAHVRDDIEREIRADELREIMRESELEGLKDVAQEAGGMLKSARDDLESIGHEVHSTVQEPVQESKHEPAQESVPAPAPAPQAAHEATPPAAPAAEGDTGAGPAVAEAEAGPTTEAARPVESAAGTDDAQARDERKAPSS